MVITHHRCKILKLIKIVLQLLIFCGASQVPFDGKFIC